MFAGAPGPRSVGPLSQTGSPRAARSCCGGEGGIRTHDLRIMSPAGTTNSPTSHRWRTPGTGHATGTAPGVRRPHRAWPWYRPLRRPGCPVKPTGFPRTPESGADGAPLVDLCGAMVENVLESQIPNPSLLAAGALEPPPAPVERKLQLPGPYCFRPPSLGFVGFHELVLRSHGRPLCPVGVPFGTPNCGGSLWGTSALEQLVGRVNCNISDGFATVYQATCTWNWPGRVRFRRAAGANPSLEAFSSDSALGEAVGSAMQHVGLS